MTAPWMFHDLGNLLLAFVMLWAYLAFSQFMIIWMENLKDEIPWYLHRTNGGWEVIAVGLGRCFNSRCRFSCCCRAPSKRKPRRFRAVAAADRADAAGSIYSGLSRRRFIPRDLACIGRPAGAARHRRPLVRRVSRPTEGRPLLPFRDPRFIAIVEEAGLGDTWLTKT